MEKISENEIWVIEQYRAYKKNKHDISKLIKQLQTDYNQLKLLDRGSKAYCQLYLSMREDMDLAIHLKLKNRYIKKAIYKFLN